jgi:hypothetical protein
MGETTDQIASELESKREDLRSNLEELQNKVSSVTDWRQQVRRNPTAMVGIAFGSGLLLASLIGRPRRRVEYNLGRAAQRQSPGKSQLRGVWDDIQGALIGVFATKVTNTLADVLPDFRDQLRAASRRRPFSTASSGGNGIQGEGGHERPGRYRADRGRFVKTGGIERTARAAEPQNESDAEDLLAAEAAARARAKPS